MENEHDQAPENPDDGQEFTCTCCGYTAIWAADLGENGQWFS